MPPISRLQIFGLDSHADFHRRAANVVHAALHDDEVAEVNRLAKIDSIH
jgi:hypothetical protein